MVLFHQEIGLLPAFEQASSRLVLEGLQRFTEVRHRKYVTEPREQISFQPTTEHAEELRKIAGLLTLASVDLNQPMVPHIMAFYASCVAGTVEVCTPTAGKAFQFWEKAVKRTTSKSLTSEVDEDIDQLV